MNDLPDTSTRSSDTFYTLKCSFRAAVLEALGDLIYGELKGVKEKLLVLTRHAFLYFMLIIDVAKNFIIWSYAGLAHLRTTDWTRRWLVAGERKHSSEALVAEGVTIRTGVHGPFAQNVVVVETYNTD